VLDRAWRGLTTVSLQPSGFVSHCQAVGDRPATPYTATAPRTAPTATSPGTLHADAPPFCVGALLLAGSELARLTGAMSTGRPATATAQQTGNEAARAVDGDMTSRWSAPGFPQTLTVDLGSPRWVSNVQVVPHLDRPYRYRVQMSTDRATWTTVVDRTASSARGTMVDDLRQGVEARYVRLVVTGVADASTTWVAIRELSVHDRYDPRANLALRRPTTATSSATSAAPALATDHAPVTAWRSAATPSGTAPQRLTVDLGAARTVDTVRLHARAGSGPRATAVEGSTDGTRWTTLATATLPDRQGPHTWVVSPTSVRWVRVSASGAYGPSGVAVEELEVFGR
jgi:beta-glucosidase